MHRKLRPDHPNIGRNIGAGSEEGEPFTPWPNAPRHNKQFVIKRRRTGVIVGKKSNGSAVVPSADHATTRRFRFQGACKTAMVNRLGQGGGGQGGSGLERVKRIANCELALCSDYSNRYYPRSSALPYGAV